MATGASTADVAILLVDARHGVRAQTRRHAAIARLLGISSFVLAVNKMDLVGFDGAVFDGIRAALPETLAGAAVQAIPISALSGDNVIETSPRTPWYDGPALLPFLETADTSRPADDGPFRMPVQLVIRPDHAFRGYAGQIASGRIAVGDEIAVWPSGLTTRVARIVTFDGDLDAAVAPMSITLVLEDDVDVSRGDTLASGTPHVGRRFTANLVWMDERPLRPGRPYVLKHGTRSVTATSADGLALNDIGLVTITTGRPLVFEPYAADRTTGSFILIDPATNFTAGAGMIVAPVADAGAAVAVPGAAERLAAAARVAATDADAVEAVRRLLEEVLA
jgi:sulfate adenylyltransferase large subunit